MVSQSDLLPMTMETSGVLMKMKNPLYGIMLEFKPDLSEGNPRPHSRPGAIAPLPLPRRRWRDALQVPRF
jgi:hypothetical protein